MSAYFIGTHVRSGDAAAVRRAVSDVFTAAGFRPLGDQALSAVVGEAEGEDAPPDAGDGYGVVVGAAAGAGWVSVYVADWPDSGALARGLSGRLRAPALELWVAEDTHWGYTYFEDGAVRDRFADAPEAVADTPAEAGEYLGRADALAPVLRVPVAQAEAALAGARRQAGRFAAAPVDALADAVGLPFGHAFTGYDAFFDGDPDDYRDDLEGWPQFRHLLFAPPPGREGLAE